MALPKKPPPPVTRTFLGAVAFIDGSFFIKLTSRKFYNLLKINVFFRLIFLTRTRNIGMMEYWNDDLKKMTFFYLIPAKRNFTITQLSIFSLSRRLSEPEAQNPIFQHSNCKRSELT
jgi:hypothetical protein